MGIALRDYQSEELCQVRKSFALGARKTLAVLPCGAGKTVMFAYMSARHIEKSADNRVLFLVHRRELVEQAQDTFERCEIHSDRITIGMAQTITRHIESVRNPTLIVIDEAHHATANTWGRILSAFPNAYVVGLTATPCRLDGAGLGSVFEDMEVGVSAKWLIAHKWLCDYDYYAPHINLEGASWKPKGADYDMEDTQNVLEKAQIYGDVMKYLDMKRKTIIYCPTVAMSRAIAGRIGVSASHFDGDTPKKERDEIIARFRKGDTRVLCNCDLIGEGFDVPDCDCIMLLRPTKSVALYIQQSMRCLRPNGDKRAAIYDFVGNCYRHGLPSDDRKWSLTKKAKCRNESGEKDLLVRECSNCFRVYEGTSPICPYCHFDNGKTKKQIEEDEKAKLEKITELKRMSDREEQSRCWSFQSLVELGRKRGYKNPAYWASMIMKSRKGNEII